MSRSTSDFFAMPFQEMSLDSDFVTKPAINPLRMSSAIRMRRDCMSGLSLPHVAATRPPAHFRAVIQLKSFMVICVVENEIERAFMKYDMEEGKDVVGLYFKDSLFRSYSWLQEFVKAIENALPKSVESKKMVVLLFETDIGKMVGLMVRQETSIQHNLICLDELFLEAGDWIDIGEPLLSGQAFPVTVKSLVFNQKKEH